MRSAITCINCQRKVENYRVEHLNSFFCGTCAKNMGMQRSFGSSVSFEPKLVKVRPVKSSKLVVSMLRDDDPLRIVMPFKRVNRPTMEVIRNESHRVELVPVSCLVNRVVDNNVASTNDLSDASSEFHTGITWSSNRNSGN